MRSKKVSYEQKITCAELTLAWCILKFGRNNRKKKELKLSFRKNLRTIKRSVLYGYYSWHTCNITIYINNCENYLHVIRTIIHEYTHYLQPITKAEFYEKKYSYYNNPFEKEAKSNELNFYKECYKFIKNQLTISASGISRKNNKLLSA